jgi:hypothetical protein
METLQNRFETLSVVENPDAAKIKAHTDALAERLGDFKVEALPRNVTRISYKDKVIDVTSHPAGYTIGLSGLEKPIDEILDAISGVMIQIDAGNSPRGAGTVESETKK